MTYDVATQYMTESQKILVKMYKDNNNISFRLQKYDNTQTVYK